MSIYQMDSQTLDGIESSVGTSIVLIRSSFAYTYKIFCEH